MSYTKDEVLAYLNDVDDARTVGALLWTVKSSDLVKKNLATDATYETLRQEYMAAHPKQKVDDEMKIAEKSAGSIPWDSRLLEALEERTQREYAREGGRRRKSRKTKKSRKTTKKSRRSVKKTRRA